MERRDFIKLLAGSGMGLAVSQSPLRRLVETHPLVPRLGAYEEAFKTAACTLCPAGCGLKVRLVNGNVVGVRGNPLDPMSGGGLCVKGLSLQQQLYHPDRLKKPLKRAGARGGDQWEVTEWDEALEAVAGRLAELKERAPERIVFLNGRPFGFMNRLVDRWMRYLGSPHHVADHYVSALPIAAERMFGRAFHPAAELDELDLVVSVGDPFLDYTLSPVHVGRAYARFREADPAHRGHLIVFDDARGVTGEKADEFYRIEPGTYGAVLLALANVLVRYEWYDHEFVDRHVLGLDEWQRLVLSRFPPERAEELTGVPSTVFYEVAGRLSRSQRKVVLSGPPALNGPGALHNAMAMLGLNGLLGSVDRDLHLTEPVEGVVSLPELPERELPERLDRKRFPLAAHAPWAFPEIIADDPESVEALFLYYSNPISSHPAGERWREALAHVPQVISFSPFLDESSAYADWILPESLGLERYQEMIHPPVSASASIAVTQPMWEEPLYDTRSVGDVLLELVKVVDPDAATAFPWGDYVEYMEDCLVQLHRTKSGTPFLPPREFRSFVELARRGYWASDVADEDAFFERLYESGGFVQPLYLPGQWGRIFRTESGRMELSSASLRATVEDHLKTGQRSLESLGLNELSETYHLPDFIPSAGEAPLGKVSWLITWNTGSTAEIPWWWEVVGMHRGLQWAMWAELGTDSAESARLDTAGRPEVRFQLGAQEHRLPGVLRFGGHPELVVLPVGFGRTVVRTTPLPGGINILALAGYRPDPLTGLPSYYVKLGSLEVKEAST